MESSTQSPKRPNKQNSRPVIRRSIEVKTEIANRLLTYGPGFWKVTAAMYRIEAVWRMASNSEIVDRIEAAVKEYLQKTKEELLLEKEELKQLLDQYGIVEMPDYTKKESILVKITSPFISNYIGLIQALDDVLQFLDTLWLFELITGAERKAKIQEWVSRLRKLRLRIRQAEKRLRLEIAQEKSRLAKSEPSKPATADAQQLVLTEVVA